MSAAVLVGSLHGPFPPQDCRSSWVWEDPVLPDAQRGGYLTLDWDGKWPTLTLKQPLLLKGRNSWWGEGASMFRIQLWQIRQLLYTTNVYGYRQWQTEWNVSPNIWKLRCQKKCINGNDHQMCRSQNQRAMNETRKEVVKNYADTIIYAIGPEILVPTMCCCNNYFHLTKQHLIPHSLFSG